MGDSDYYVTPVSSLAHNSEPPVLRNLTSALPNGISSPFSSGRSSNLAHDSEPNICSPISNESGDVQDGLFTEIQVLSEQVNGLYETFETRFGEVNEKLVANSVKLNEVAQKVNSVEQTGSEQSKELCHVNENIERQFRDLNDKLAQSFTTLDAQLLQNEKALDEHRSEYTAGLELLTDELQCVKQALKLILENIFERKQSTVAQTKESDVKIQKVEMPQVFSSLRENEEKLFVTGEKSAGSHSPPPDATRLPQTNEQSQELPLDDPISGRNTAVELSPMDSVDSVCSASLNNPQVSDTDPYTLLTNPSPASASSLENVGGEDDLLDSDDVQARLNSLGQGLSAWQVQVLMEKHSVSRKTRPVQLTEEEFDQLCLSLSAPSKDENSSLQAGSNPLPRRRLEFSSEQGNRSVHDRERAAFSQWINECLSSDPDLKHILPLDTQGHTLCDKIQDGILLCKLINHSFPEVIDERAINKSRALNTYRRYENLTLALNSAEAIGCNVVNITANDLASGKPEFVLDILWQIIRIGLLRRLSIQDSPELAQLMEEDEKIEQLLVLTPECLLLRWVNHHLSHAGSKRRCNNFGSDINDSEIYAHLLRQVAPRSTESSVRKLFLEEDLLVRAELVLREAEKLGCRIFVTAEDIVLGAPKLNLAFVANLFNNHPGIEAFNALTKQELLTQVKVEETSEEKSILSWINSVGVNPPVNRLYTDLRDGLILLQLLDVIKPGIVDWNRVTRKFSGKVDVFKKLQNCNYAVEISKQLKLSIGAINGENLARGETKPTLAFISQLMKAHTLSLLSQLSESGKPIVESEIISWVNQTLKDAGKDSSIKNFQDSTIANAEVFIDLIDSIKPGVIYYENMRHGGTPEENLANAKYAISMARKIGARIYALPEDIAEVKSKMVMTAFACLMAADLVPVSQEKIKISPIRRTKSAYVASSKSVKHGNASFD